MAAAGTYEHLGADILSSIKEEIIGFEGMKIDRMFFEKFEDTVRSNDFIAKAVEAGQWDRVIDYVNREVFDKPEEYYSLDKLRKAAAVDRRLTLREILEKIFNLIPRFKSKDELLEEEFAKFVADYKPEEATAIPAIKTYFKAYITSGRVRDIIDSRQFTDLATNPVFSTRDFKAVPDKYRMLVPEYIKDYIPLNQFAARGGRHGKDQTQRRISRAAQLSDCNHHLRCDLLVLRALPGTADPDERPDGAGRPQRAQNIAEGSRASATSSQTELRLVNVARSSLEELLLDYEDYLRHRRLPQWAPESPEALAVRRVGKSDRPDPSDRTDGAHHALYAQWLDHPTPPCAPTRSSASSTRPITCSTGRSRRWKRRLSRGRLQRTTGHRPHRRARPPEQLTRSDGSADRTDRARLIPACPKCGKPMALRTAQKGKNPGKQFWGCTGYPECKNIAEI